MDNKIKQVMEIQLFASMCFSRHDRLVGRKISSPLENKYYRNFETKNNALKELLGSWTEESQIDLVQEFQKGYFASLYLKVLKELERSKSKVQKKLHNTYFMWIMLPAMYI